MFTRLLLILLISTSHFCMGLDNGPEILRVCLNNDTKTATLFWNQPNDLCNSFVRYKIFSSENNGPWSYVGTVDKIATTNYPVFLPDLTSSWKFKLISYYACNGIDSFVSNPQIIDQSTPSPLELDSVSFDPISQKLCAGWKINPSSDTKGYWIYNYTNSVWDKVLETNKTFIVLNNFSKLNPAKVAIATYDSCDNFAPISNNHQAAYLNGVLDTCTKEVSLKWTLYQGWANINQYLVLNKNNNGFSQSYTLLPSQTSFIINNITLGDNLCYYVRTEDVATKKTSSSNTVCFITRKLKIPAINYLNNVTVNNDISIKLSFTADNFADTDSFLIEKAENTSTFTPLYKLKHNPSKSYYEIEDISVDVNNKTYSYRIQTIDKCRNVSSVSNIGKSILLSKPTLKENSYEFNWSLYSGWEMGISSQTVEISENRFTWNFFKNEKSSASKLFFSKEELLSDSLCFRIKNYETVNSQNSSAISISNTKCIYAISDFYIPGTINPYSKNNILKVYGSGLDKNRGKIEVYNRWGERVFETNNIEQGWDGKINDSFALQGCYLYKAYFFDQQNNYYLKTGTVFIIR